MKSIRDDGYDITLRMRDAAGITPGKTQVMYKGLPVGMVKRLSITKDLQHVNASIKIHILVYEQHAPLVTTSTRFWDLSGIQFKANLSDISLNVGTFKSILAGGALKHRPEESPPQSGRPFRCTPMPVRPGMPMTSVSHSI